MYSRSTILFGEGEEIGNHRSFRRGKIVGPSEIPVERKIFRLSCLNWGGGKAYHARSMAPRLRTTIVVPRLLPEGGTEPI